MAHCKSISLFSYERYAQILGIDFSKKKILVSKIDTIRIILVLTAKKKRER